MKKFQFTFKCKHKVAKVTKNTFTRSGSYFRF